MDEAYQVLTTLREPALSARLSPEAKQVPLHCMDRLPKLNDGFAKTNESRFGDEVTALARAVLKWLGQPSAGADAGRVVAAVVAHLGELHERLGLAPIRYKAPAAPRRATRERAPQPPSFAISGPQALWPVWQAGANRPAAAPLRAAVPSGLS
jgi:hypothetical protein